MGGWGQTRVGHGPAEQGEHRRLGRRTDSPLRPQIRRCPVGANLDPSPGRVFARLRGAWQTPWGEHLGLNPRPNCRPADGVESGPAVSAST